MSFECPNSLLAHFPETIYRSVGATMLLPQLLEVIDPHKLSGVQFLRGGRVRLTFKESSFCEDLLQCGLTLGETAIRLQRADPRIRLVHLKDLPLEISDEIVSSAFSSFGVVLSIRHSTFADYPSLKNGNRVLEMLLESDIPSSVPVDQFKCRVWYAQQPPHCIVCREPGHWASACPLSGLCRRCRQPGHMARECRQAWGATPTSSSFLLGPVCDDDDDADKDEYSPPADVPDDDPTDDEMASGDEEVAAQAALPDPPPPRACKSSASVSPSPASESSSKSQVPPVSPSPATVSPSPVIQSKAPPASLPVPPELHACIVEFARRSYTVLSTPDLQRVSSRDISDSALRFASSQNRLNDTFFVKYISGVLHSVLLQVRSARSPVSDDEVNIKRKKSDRR